MTQIDPNRIKLSQLRVLVAVADWGNFSEAALRMHISQAAVSYAIATLEEELGISLLFRGRQGAKLTPAGQEIIKDARQILQLIEGMTERALSHRGLQGGRVRIAAYRSVAARFLPEFLAQFHRQYNQIRVSITECSDCAEIERALQDRAVDVGLTYLPASSFLQTWPLMRDEYVVLLPPQAQISGVELTWSDLTEHPFVSVVPEFASYNRVRTHLQRHGGVKLVSTFEVREATTMVNMVAQGLGMTIIPRLAAEPIPSEVQLHRLPVALDRPIGVAMVADALHPPAVFAFVDLLRNSGLGGTPAVHPQIPTVVEPRIQPAPSAQSVAEPQIASVQVE